MKKRRMKEPRPKRFLGWLAFLSLAIGGGVAYFISQQEFNPDAQSQIVLTLGLTGTIAGICLISMSANWWMRH